MMPALTPSPSAINVSPRAPSPPSSPPSTYRDAELNLNSQIHREHFTAGAKRHGTSISLALTDGTSSLSLTAALVIVVTCHVIGRTLQPQPQDENGSTP